ncbi:TetR/AcrR family transcriptional regulator [Nonomuraea rhizosphaerae]|uniref:TetR/AcrR family transcriptional regulator n=1 Tax=Nonomuraea rhizosphaerae TaxID=2665663 RepID=UPI001C5FE95C|nr:TetR/AcrR family transcriptional regulator [Nonomuraea rhizosphaerae]
MTEEHVSGEGRPLRADARRKREAILTAAVDVFAERGIDIALDEVARRAGVGIATLYRHFPTREALITGAYVREIDLLCDGVDDLLAAMPADEALIAWMQRFVGYVAGRPGMALALKSIVTTTDAQALKASHDRVHSALALLVGAGQRDGLIRADASSEDLANGLSGVSLANSQPGTRERADRLIVLLVDGLRHTAPRSATNRFAAGPPGRIGNSHAEGQ